jgi:hypothetical protein
MDFLQVKRLSEIAAMEAFKENNHFYQSKAFLNQSQR